MKMMRDSSEAEMVFEFLRTEFYSDRFSEQLKKAISRNPLPSHRCESSQRGCHNIRAKYRGLLKCRQIFRRWRTLSEYDFSDCGFQQLYHCGGSSQDDCLCPDPKPLQ